MRRTNIAILLLLFAINLLKSQDTYQIVIGTKHSIKSTILNEDREYWISLPDSYHHSESSYKTYPLLILLDGNLHFKSITGMIYSSDLELEEFLVERIGLVQGAKHSHSSGYGAYLQRSKRPILSLENLQF